MEEPENFIDLYCERVFPGLMDEPFNALTNLAFMIAAVLCWRWLKGYPGTVTRILCALLFLIGVSSGLLHTFATPWGAMVDVGFIALFVLTYIYAANRHFFHLSPLYSIVLLVIAFSSLVPVGWVAGQLMPFLESSASYASIALLIFLYGIIMLWIDKEVGYKLFIGVLALSVSIGFRTVDEPLCEVNPLGTHWVWHVLNSIMLAWMIIVLRDKMFKNGLIKT